MGGTALSPWDINELLSIGSTQEDLSWNNWKVMAGM